MGSYQNLIGYKKSYELAMAIFDVTKSFPKEERYSLTDQIRRSSRSVCANLAEAYQRRSYPAHFKSKLYDALAENAETQVWLQFSKDCEYMSIDAFDSLLRMQTEAAKLISYMITNPKTFS